MDLIIGNTSQLVHYFDGVESIPSRNFDKKVSGYDTVIITFTEQRTFLDLDESEFIKVNVDYTSKVIDLVSPYNNKVVIFGTSELWNNHSGPIQINTPFDYKYSPYIKSKELLVNKLQEKRFKNEWKNVYILHPFNFNTPYRNKGFLFGKIFDSIINQTPITVGNIDINRDIIHPKLIKEGIKNIDKDCIVGSGQLTNVKNFIKNLYKHYNMVYENFVKEEVNKYSPHNNKNFWFSSDIKYTNLLNDTIIDIDLYKIKKK
jgi:nucleoside-diphosphate-sugar epimerase